MADILGIDPKTVGETVAAIIIALGAGWTARRSGEKQAERHEPPAASVVAASVISDSAITALRQTIRDAAEQRHDDIRHLRDDLGNARDAVCALTRAIEAGLPPAAGVNMAALMARLAAVEKRA